MTSKIAASNLAVCTVAIARNSVESVGYEHVRSKKTAAQALGVSSMIKPCTRRLFRWRSNNTATTSPNKMTDATMAPGPTAGNAINLSISVYSPKFRLPTSLCKIFLITSR